MRFNGLFQPLHEEKPRLFERQNQPKSFIQKWNSKSSFGFTAIPTKELCRVYLQKPVLLASKDVIDAQAKPPHSQKKGSKLMGLKISGEMANHMRFGRRYDQKNLNLKLRYYTNAYPLKPKIRKKENSPRWFSPLGFGIDSQLRDRKKGQYLSFEKKSKEMKKLCDGSTFSQKKNRVVREVSSKLIVSTSRDSVLSLEQICKDRVAGDLKLRHTSSLGFISKDEIEDSFISSPGCQMNSEEAHQPSPVSVLEPMFYEDMLEDYEELPHIDFHGLEKQLDTLKSESESYSYGNEMEVSSDDESVFDYETKENKYSDPIGFLDTQETNDLSYIDDNLAEVVLLDKNLVPDKQDSLELVITLKIFEKLEKKYYRDTLWKRCQRRILFDRVNTGLIEILESFKATPTSKKPVSRRLGIVLSTHGLKQELWKEFAREDKRAKKESWAKVPIIDIDEWLEPEADDDSVVCELESLILNELQAEVVSFV